MGIAQARAHPSVQKVQQINNEDVSGSGPESSRQEREHGRIRKRLAEPVSYPEARAPLRRGSAKLPEETVMKAKDFIDIIEYTRAFKDKEPKRLRREKDSDPFDELNKIKRIHDLWDKFEDELGKINKKEDKKPDNWWAKASFLQKMTVVSTFAPLVFMTQLFAFVVIIKASANILGLK